MCAQCNALKGAIVIIRFKSEVNLSSWNRHDLRLKNKTKTADKPNKYAPLPPPPNKTKTKKQHPKQTNNKQKRGRGGGGIKSTINLISSKSSQPAKPFFYFFIFYICQPTMPANGIIFTFLYTSGHPASLLGVPINLHRHNEVFCLVFPLISIVTMKCFAWCVPL